MAPHTDGYDRPGREDNSEVLSRTECLRLLGQTDSGRVAVSVGALPTVLPVRFSVVGDDVVFPAVRGGEIDSAARDAVVAFEADQTGPGGGWSVVVTGAATEIADPDELGRLRAVYGLGDSGASLCWFRVPTAMVSGRRISRAPIYVGGSVPAGLTARLTGPAPALPGAGPAPFDDSSGEPIPLAECLALLATEELGRLVVVVDGRPLVFPVNYVLDGDTVVFRTAAGTKLDAVRRSFVAFEVDRAPTSGSGWSVVVEGWAHEVTSADAPGLRERLAALPLFPVAGGDRHRYVRIVPAGITGSRSRRP